MKTEVLVDANANTLLYACSPESADETENWYEASYALSISQYTHTIAKIINQVYNLRPFFISFYPLYSPQNALEKKLGMTGVFKKLEIQFQAVEEMKIKYDAKGTDYLIAVSDAYVDNLRILFCSRVYSLLCFTKEMTPSDLLQRIGGSSIEGVLEHLAKEHLIVSFLDCGCDGNSITVHHADMIEGYL